MFKTLSIITATVLSLNPQLNETKPAENPITLSQPQNASEQAKALFEQGFDYRYGISLPIDNAKANALLKQAADLGNADAAFFYGLRMADEGRLAEAETYAEKAKALGNDKTPYISAIIGEEKGLPEEQVTEDYQKAFRAMKAAVDKGDLHYVNLVGYSYRLGLGTEENIKQAIAYFKQGEKQGNALSMGHLSEIYFEQNKLKQAKPLLLKSAEKNNAAAQYNLANIFLPPESAEYRDWMEKAAKNGMPEAYLSLGNYYYQRGEMEQTIDNFEKAAAQGNSQAMMLLSELYAAGEGVAENPQKALDYLKQAAEAGDEDAIISLIQRYLSGTGGLPKDQKQAQYWWERLGIEGEASLEGLEKL